MINDLDDVMLSVVGEFDEEPSVGPAGYLLESWRNHDEACAVFLAAALYGTPGDFETPLGSMSVRRVAP